jgi:hypothetical protein
MVSGRRSPDRPAGTDSAHGVRKDVPASAGTVIRRGRGRSTARGRGPFERHGLPTTVPLLLAFLAVCLLEAVAGTRVWGEHLDGGILALALLPVEAAFWWGSPCRSRHCSLSSARSCCWAGGVLGWWRGLG